MNGDDNQRPVSGDSDGGWQYKPSQNEPAPQAMPEQRQPANAAATQEVAWTASEFIARHKGAGWYIALVLIIIVVGLLVWLLSQDVVTVGAVVFAIVLFGVSAVRKPRVLTYRMGGKGLAIGDKFYPYAEFKSFSVIQEDAFSSISILPLKRFMPPISVYYEPQDEDAIVTILAAHLPMDNRQPDVVDQLMRKLRF
jgi:hypothetical protein